MSVLPSGHDVYRSSERSVLRPIYTIRLSYTIRILIKSRVHFNTIRLAKQMKKRLWKDYEPSAPSVAIDNKEFTGKVLCMKRVQCLLVLTTLTKIIIVHLRWWK